MWPPRHGKSEYISRFLPAWYIGLNPTERVILASYEAEFAAGWGRKSRDILAAYGHLFGTSVREDVYARDSWETIEGGGMVTAGVGGAITGRGANLIIVDDPHKNAEDALSETMRNKVWDWWQSTLYTRREPGCVCIVIQTRWHQDDLIGKLLAEDASTGWAVIRVPALAEADDPLGRAEGAALWPERYPADELAKTKERIGSYWWSALYQQSPIPLGESMFRQSWESWYTLDHGIYSLHRHGDPTPIFWPASRCLHFGMMDLAVSTKQTADYTVLESYAMTPEGDLLLLDVQRKRLQAPEQPAMIRNAVSQHGLKWVGIEATAYQLSLVQYASSQGLPVKAIKADRDKVARAMTASAWQEQGKLYFPKHAVWLPDFRSELYSFPSGAHDDQVDPLAYAAIYASKRAAQGNLE
jgi:predicted phage terminase large subunit-like protein